MLSKLLISNIIQKNIIKEGGFRGNLGSPHFKEGVSGIKHSLPTTHTQIT